MSAPAGETPSAIDKVRAELLRYDHLLMTFAVEECSSGALELTIEFKNRSPGIHVYRAPLHPRDIAGPNFAWTFQRLLYDCVHDYMVELFVKTPQSRDVETR